MPTSARISCWLPWLLLAACQSESRGPAPPVATPPAVLAAPFRYSPTTTVLPVPPTGSYPKPAAQPAAALPPGMVRVPGGYTQIGSAEGMAQEKPLFWVAVKPFLLDVHEVTVGQFRQFVQATGYRTQAERFGDGGVLNEATGEWELVKGADWQHPYGPAAGPAAAALPVTQVSWHDARTYAAWAGKRLPTEMEWEHAARNARNSRTRYPFGNALTDSTGRALANTWNGTFPAADAVTDGFHHAAPVGSFGASALGLQDMAGNVWEWCQNVKQPYPDLLAHVPPPTDTSAERAQRGGSFLCEPGWCHGYRVSARSGSSPETALMHVGFRCAQDL